MYGSMGNQKENNNADALVEVQSKVYISAVKYKRKPGTGQVYIRGTENEKKRQRDAKTLAIPRQEWRPKLLFLALEKRGSGMCDFTLRIHSVIRLIIR